MLEESVSADIYNAVSGYTYSETASSPQYCRRRLRSDHLVRSTFQKQERHGKGCFYRARYVLPVRNTMFSCSFTHIFRMFLPVIQSTVLVQLDLVSRVQGHTLSFWHGQRRDSNGGNE